MFVWRLLFLGKGTFMKHIFTISIILVVVCTLSAHADNFVWQFYDSNFYAEVSEEEMPSVPAGNLTAITDIFYTYTFDTKSVYVTQTEWLSDGAGGEYEAPYSSEFHYHNIYLNNPNLDTELFLVGVFDEFLTSYREQATTDINTMIRDIVNQTNVNNISEHELNTITQMIVNDIFNGADITSLDIYKNLQQSITTLSQRYDNISAIATAIDNTTITNTIKTVFSAINNQISNRILNINGRSGGDEPTGVGIWTQGLANYAKKTGDDSFNAHTFGITMGIDKKFSDDLLVGFTYTYNRTSANAELSNIDINGHTVFVYGEYRPLKEWYIDTLLSVGTSSYKEKLGIANTNYDIYNLGTELISGYDWNNGFGLFGGARFLNIKQKDYLNFVNQRIKGDNNSVLTLVGGVKYNTNLSSYLTTNLHINTTYDVLKSDDTAKLVNIDGIVYQINKGYIEPFGIETGISFNLYDNNWDFDIGYDLEWHSNFISHTGHIRVKYSF